MSRDPDTAATCGAGPSTSPTCDWQGHIVKGGSVTVGTRPGGSDDAENHAGPGIPWLVRVLGTNHYEFTNVTGRPAENVTIEDGEHNLPIQVGSVGCRPGDDIFVLRVRPGIYWLAWKHSDDTDSGPVPHVAIAITLPPAQCTRDLANPAACGTGADE